MPLNSPAQGGVVNAVDVAQLVNLLTGAMTDQPVTVSNRVRAQLSGASGGSGGYVGATAGGPPTGGTFNAGDFIVDALGVMYVCTVGGTPGTWQRAAPKGRVGGTRYNAGTGVIIAGAGIGPAEGLTGMQTPALTLEANRAFVIRVRVRFLLANATNVTLRVRETNLAGAVRATYDDTGLTSAFAYTKEFSGVYDTGSTNEAHTFVVTGQQGTGLANYLAGDSATAVYVDVTDVGPAGSLTVV